MTTTSYDHHLFLEPGPQAQSVSYNANLAALQESAKELGAKNQELSRENSQLKQRLGQVAEDCHRAKELGEQLNLRLVQQETILSTKEVRTVHC